MTKEVLSTYEEIATEYYDSDRHPTCANFRAASHQSLLKFLRSADVNGKIVCEVGPGKSLLAEVLAELDCRPAEIILIDLSPSMLRYSAQSGSRQKHAIIGDGRILPLRGRSIDLLVSSLGDPYNEISFWTETSRVLKHGSDFVFTTPSYEWAKTFRGEDGALPFFAEFETLRGCRIRVPSFIYSMEQQLKLIESAGLQVKDFYDVPIASLMRDRLSPKLIQGRDIEASVIDTYIIRKP